MKLLLNINSQDQQAIDVPIYNEHLPMRKAIATAIGVPLPRKNGEVLKYERRKIKWIKK